MNKNLLDCLILTNSRLGREAYELNYLIRVHGEIRSRLRLAFFFQNNKMFVKEFANPNALLKEEKMLDQ